MAEHASGEQFPILLPKYITRKEETLLFTGRQYGSKYDVLTSDNLSLFVVAPEPSIGRRMNVQDAFGKPLFSTRKGTFHLGASRYFIEKPEGTFKATTLCRVDFKMFASGTKFTVTGCGVHAGELIFARSSSSAIGTITNGINGPVMAHVEYKIIMLRKEYRVVVAEGVDAALISGLVICLDDQEKSHHNAPSIGGARWG